MLTLSDSLAQSPRRFLLALTRVHALKGLSEAPKADLVTALTIHLTDAAHLTALIQSLTAAELTVLVDLKLAGGQLARRHLRLRHGDVRPYRPWQPDAPRQPWLQPISAVERLWFLGLIFWNPKTEVFHLPLEVQTHLPQSLPLEAGESRPGDSLATQRLGHDLASLLALVVREPIRLIHQRWLPPRSLARWGALQAQPPATPQPGSELQTQRRRFIHYLAEAAALIDLGRAGLTLTPAAWLWLGTTPEARLQTLWQAWVAPDPERWRRFRLPGYTWLAHPGPFLAGLHQGLATLLPRPMGDFIQALLAQSPQLTDFVPALVEDPPAEVAAVITALLQGPLCRLGVIDIVDLEESSIEEPPAGAMGAVIRLTPWGAARLGGAGESPPPALPAPGHFSLTPQPQPDPLAGTLRVQLQHGLPDPTDWLLVLLLTAPPAGETPPLTAGMSALEQAHTITAGGFIGLLQRGWSAPALMAGLERLAGRGLTGPEKTLLRPWSAAAGRMSLRMLPVLETNDAGIISRLAASRRGGRYLVRTLSPRAVVVDGFRLGQLARRLTQQEGVPPLMVGGEWPEEGPAGAEESLPPLAGPADLSPGGLAHLALALRVYEALGQFIKLPSRPPSTLLGDLNTALDDSGRAAVEGAAAQTVAALQEALVGRVVYPPWPEAGLPPETSQSLIEEALAHGSLLDMEYDALSTGMITRRRVEPYRLDRRGALGVTYLVGFCHRAQAERHFRLDRIRSLALVAAESPGGALDTHLVSE